MPGDGRIGVGIGADPAVGPHPLDCVVAEGLGPVGDPLGVDSGEEPASGRAAARTVKPFRLLGLIVGFGCFSDTKIGIGPKHRDRAQVRHRRINAPKVQKSPFEDHVAPCTSGNDLRVVGVASSGDNDVIARATRNHLFAAQWFFDRAA